MTSSSEDTEITLGTGKLLVLFFVLVAICAGSFSLGYKLGSKSEPALSSAAIPMSGAAGSVRSSSGAASLPATQYKPVEQKSTTPDASASAADGKPATPGDSANAGSSTSNAASPSTNPTAPATTPANNADPATTLPVASYFVQVAAVTKQEDADSLVDALKKKQYPAFVAASAAADKFFRVQVGPFPDIQEAEATRTRLIGDGYNPIVKK